MDVDSQNVSKTHKNRGAKRKLDDSSISGKDSSRYLILCWLSDVF